VSQSFSSCLFVVFTYSSSLRLRYSEPSCASRLENPPVYLGQWVKNLTDIGLGGIISSFRCDKETPIKRLGVANFCNGHTCSAYTIATKDRRCSNFKKDGLDGTITSFNMSHPGLLCAGYE